MVSAATAGKLPGAFIEAAALASYWARPGPWAGFWWATKPRNRPKHVSDDFGLCWVHEGRHYKELSPVVPQHEQQLEAFRTRYLGPLRYPVKC